ncbi:hypothetical protein HPT27_17665 [Permianibacter sp. IMCC34836]|uniref:TorF family putative porin n=1 Tax=Permianibacter fluminis TaxID=2738515 RepID=UPI001551933A|nr:TorF family putative porin [Permianibacter fluminis]NQD38848.1 hypothetical protein [Permianibacter fluminis]
MINKNWVRTAVAAAILAGSGSVMAEVTGNVAVVSDYVFDGISQTDNGPALQGGVDWSAESGLYAGAWASTVDFGEGSDSNLETDWYVGYGFGSDDVAFDVGVVFYKYLPSGDDIDYNEIYFGVTFAENLTLKYWYADDVINSGLSNSRIKATYSAAINDDWSIPLEFTVNDPEEGDSYNHYKVGVATTLGSINAELSYQKTDIDDEGDDDFADIVYSDGGFVLSLSMDF